MAKRMTDDEVHDYAYNKLFGDLDNIESGSRFGEEEGDTEGAAENAGNPGLAGIELTIKPLMAAAEEGAKPDDEEEEGEDKLKGISDMSPLMSQLHGKR